MTTPNLILGIAEGMEWETLETFVCSVQQTSFDGELHIFVAGTSPRTLRALRCHGVHVHCYRRAQLKLRRRVFDAYNPPLRRLGSARLARLYPSIIRMSTSLMSDPVRGRAFLAAPISVPVVARYFRYYRFLSERVGRYANVMLADTRDVFFQRDPFAFPIGDRVLCFLEHPGFTLGSQGYNREWITRLFGERTMRELEDKPISNSGVVIGSARGVLEYLREMVEVFVRIPQRVRSDQAVHNFIAHTVLAPAIDFIPYGQGPVINLAITPKREVAAALPDGYSAFHVIHQYDRHPELQRLLLDRLMSTVPNHINTSPTSHPFM